MLVLMCHAVNYMPDACSFGFFSKFLVVKDAIVSASLSSS